MTRDNNKPQICLLLEADNQWLDRVVVVEGREVLVAIGLSDEQMDRAIWWLDPFQWH